MRAKLKIYREIKNAADKQHAFLEPAKNSNLRNENIRHQSEAKASRKPRNETS